MKKQLGLAWLLGSVSAGLMASEDLIFSEYIEGSSNNKALEIYNNTGASVDLSAYEVQMYFNGGDNASLTLPLSGGLDQGDVYVLVHNSAQDNLIEKADLVSSASWFNGDDAIVLLNGGVVIDSIGQIGVDPGSQWGQDLTSTQNNTLRRLPNMKGDTNAFDSFDPAQSWQGFAQNSFDGLGFHEGLDDEPNEPGDDVVSACGDTATLIHSIQGSAEASTLVGSVHTIEAIVVGDFQGSDNLNGFYLQEEDSDSDDLAETSEGIFVYGASLDVKEGDRVRVTGTVAESYTMTQLTNTIDIKVCDGGNSVTATELLLPLASLDQLENLEGMRLVLSQTLTVSDNYNLGRYGELVVSNGRLFTPTNVVSPGPAAQIKQVANDHNRIILDDGSRQQNPQNIKFPAPALSANEVVRAGDTVSGVEGVLEYAFGAYRLHPVVPPSFIASNPRTNTVALPGTGSLRVASFNVLNYFNGDGLGGGFPTARGADNQQEFQRQQDKLVSALMALDADVVGLMEIENDGYDEFSAIATLVDAINASGGEYNFVNPGVTTIGSDDIAVGLIYKPAKISLKGASKILDATVDNRFVDTKNRPALIQSFREQASGEVLTIAVNHLKSKGSDCDELNDPDMNDGQGNCNFTRTLAAQALTDYLAADPTNSGNTNVLILGDLNAYAKEDPITAITSAGYTDLLAQHLNTTAYSYVYYGQAGYLDHALASDSLKDQVTGVASWHINADEPSVLDYNTEYKTDAQLFDLYSSEPFRASDHDPVVIELNLQDKANNTDKRGDFNQSGALDQGDFIKLVRHWGCDVSRCVQFDLNQDARVNWRDVYVWFGLRAQDRT